MPTFKFTISEPETRKSYNLEVDQSKAVGLISKKIGDEFNGDVIGLGGYSLKITGGTDKDGFPMHPSVAGPGRKKILLASPPGFHPRLKGQRKRKMIRGNTISEDIVQINCKVVKKGAKPLEELVPKKEKPEEKKEEEKPTEKKIEEKKELEKTKVEKKREEKPVEKKQEELKEKPKKEAKKTEEAEPKKKEEKIGGEKTQEESQS